MFKVVEFDYNDKHRIAIEQGPDKRGIGCMLCTQVSPKVGIRSFKVAKRMDLKSVGFWKSLYYLAKSARITVG